MNDEWITIEKPQKNKNNNNKYVYKVKSFDEIKIIIIDTLCNNTIFKIPSYIYIYGSRARNKEKIDSDIDMMIFWKYPYPSYDELNLYKNKLKLKLNLNIDFVCMFITNKIIKITDEKTKCYYENVIVDAICIYPQNNKNLLIDLIDFSIKLQKI